MAYLGAASVSTFTDVKDVNLMPNIDVATPVSSAPTDRLALGVGWVRPGESTKLRTPQKSHTHPNGDYCFEGNE